ncbi:DNA cytosine methyltransferase [Pseudomonas sp. NMI1173_11]|uniref:DNA cytosine methyltransferase n=1 Tax=Pseudomonas sp. NMI1173_11 TaxID=2903145 RepID=UPI001E35EBB2|nr:DNA cytosine methyltransferase [Pseudomonas sp. NMI1173_11]MCE1001865.1 DNA cytosine methyltransferase [Pseudomonas sp. NMI1173_11]
MGAIAYYNEIEPYAAQWLRNLIRGGHIAPGDVDERSIEDVHPDDLKPYTQCHFFAGVGVWSYALRRAGWPDDRPVWTGSCPCQPFSSAGQAAGFDDERHLWPHFHWLISKRQPAVIFGEQVANKDAEPWLDLVQADVEAMDYAFGAIAFPSAGVGSPHIRDRTYWVANATHFRQQIRNRRQRDASRWKESRTKNDGCCMPDGLADLHGHRCDQGWKCQSAPWNDGVERNCTSGRMAYADIDGQRTGGWTGLYSSGEARPLVEQCGPVNGLWADADWLFCRDGKWRPVESGTFPLAHGATSRVGRLRAYGNAINAEAATQFIAAYLDTQR